MKMNKTGTEEYFLQKTQISVFLTSHGTKIAQQEEQMLMTCIQYIFFLVLTFNSCDLEGKATKLQKRCNTSSYQNIIMQSLQAFTETAFLLLQNKSTQNA